MAAEQPPAGSGAAVSPWPRRVVTALVILAILAILAAIFLPRERQEMQPSAGPVVADNPTTDTQIAESPAPQQSQTAATQQDTASSPSPTPSEAVDQTPQPTAPPSPQDQQQPAAEAPVVGPQAAAPQQPAAQPSPLFTPQEAERVVQQAEATERAELMGQVGQFVRMLRQPEYQDPDNWQLLQAALATTGTAMIPGGIQQGHAEVLAIISNAPNGAEAARQIEAISAKSPGIPLKVQRELANILATATTYDEVINGMEQVQRNNNIQFSPQTVQELRNAAAQAWQHREAVRMQYGR